MYVLQRKSTIFSVLLRRLWGGGVVRGGEERLSGIIRCCRAVYRTFALRSLIRVLYIYIILARRRPGRFVRSPLLRYTIPLNIPPYPVFASFFLEGGKKGYGWACFPLRGSTTIPPSSFSSTLVVPSTVYTRVYKEGHVISKDPPPSSTFGIRSIKQDVVVLLFSTPCSILSLVLRPRHTTAHPRAIHCGGTGWFGIAFWICFGFSATVVTARVLFLTFSFCLYIYIFQCIKELRVPSGLDVRSLRAEW